jgi:protocatechuate 3,4-dioxygenase beta subunit
MPNFKKKQKKTKMEIFTLRKSLTKVALAFLPVMFLFQTVVAQVNCSCPGNLVANPSFESGAASWNVGGGVMSIGTGATVCGINSGDFNSTSANGTGAWFSQTVTSNAVPGNTITATVYAGTHDNAAGNYLTVDFYNASWVYISNIHVQVDKVLGAAPVGPQLYTLTGVIPANTKYINVGGGTDVHGSYTKTDNWCVTMTPPPAACSCPNNIVQNPSFENSTTSWDVFGGTLSSGGGAVACGTYSGDFQSSSTTDGYARQILTSNGNAVVGSTVNIKAFAGTHDASAFNYIGIDFYDVNWNWLSWQFVEVNKVLANAPVGPQQYTLDAVVPANTKHYAIRFGTNTHGAWTKTDNWCVTVTPPANCDPNSTTAASGYCAPAPICTGTGNLNWSQTIARADGATGTVRLFDGGTTSYIIPSSFYPAALTAGTAVTVNITDVVSYDGYASRGSVTQPNERWRVVFKKSGANVFVSNWTNDVPDYQAQGFWRGALNSATLPNGADQVVIEHWSLGAGNAGNGPNSVVPASICVSVTPAATGCIGDKVWFDANGNGIQDATETAGLTGITVQLKNSAGAVIATTSTNASGNYQFCGLVAGTYRVVFPQSISGAVVTGQNVGTDDNIDSDASQANGETGDIVLSAGGNITNVDAGYCPTTLVLGNSVFNDANNNGLRDAGDAGIVGATVNLYVDNNNDNIADGAAIATTTTGADGFYTFENLGPGNYIVGVVTPAGFVSSSVNGGDPDNNINLDDNGQITVGGETRGLAITLVAGEEPDGTNTNTNTNITYDFGFYPTGCIGDRVWLDADGDGIQDATETGGLTGITVQLKNASGTVIATTTTNATGNYQFCGLAAGNYTVVFPTSINGAVVTGQNAGTDDNLDSDPSQATGETGVVTLTAGGNITNVDAGYCPVILELGDRVFNDLNNNGVREASEVGIEGVTVNLYKDDNNDNIADGAAIATTTTNATGNYIFSNLGPGNYIVGVVNPAGFTSSTVNAGDPDNNTDVDDNGQVAVGNETRGLAITLVGGDEPLNSGNFNNTYDFGFFQQTGSIGNFVWQDNNGNGIQDAGEPGISGVTVTLTYPNGSTATTTTDANGAYSFGSLPAGTYSVAFATPSGFTPTSSNQGADDNLDSDPVSGSVTNIVLGAGQTNNTIDAGFLPSILNVGNVVWYDQNNDGIRQGTETGVAGATVRLYKDENNDNVADGAAIATTTTDGNGVYNFASLAPGNYIVGVVIPAGYAVVATNGGDPDNNTDNDNNGTNTSVAGEVRSNAVSLAVGAEPATAVDGDGTNGNLTVDFALTGTGSIGDKVFADNDGDGIQDAGEPGISGVTVTLTYPNGTTATTTTDANGNYSFPNLAPGTTYSVSFGTPTGYSPTASNQGADDAADSDPVGGVVSNVSVTAGVANNTIDAGFVQSILNVGNVVWYDQNNDGIRQGTETGVAGATVRLYKDDNNDNVADGAAIATTTTSATGVYNFASLAPGNYIVGVVIPAGYAVVATNGGDPDNNTDNDNNGTNTSVAGEVRSNAVSLAVGAEPATAVDGDGTNGNLTVDFALTGTGSIGDKVFADNDGDGIQDAGEPGISGVTVTLTYPNGTTATTTTDANGNYSFPNLAPGTTYSVSFGTPSGYSPTASNQGGDDAADSDPVGGVVSNVSVTAGAANNTIDAGFVQSILNVGNVVWYDQNNDGIRQSTETGVANATVRLYKDDNNDNVADGAAIATTTTSATGVYNFANLAPGNYIVGVVIPAGYAVVATNGGDPDNNTDNDNNGTNTSVAGEVRSNAVSLAVGAEPATAVDGDGTNGNLTVDFALIGTGSIGDKVFADNDGDGIQDAGEPGISGVTVTLTYPNGTTATTTTDANGNYSFPNLAPGTTYSVSFGTPSGYSPTASNQGGDDAADSDPVGGVVSNVSVTAGVANNTIDAGFVQSILNVGNVVWYDQNNDGTKQATESGVAGATVRLYKDDNNDNVADGAAIATTTTSATGVYNFASLAPGNYIVGVVIPAGYAVVATNGGDPDNNTDNDNNGTNTSVAGEVRSNAVSLAVGAEPATAVDGDGTNGNLAVDFALTGTGSIGDKVFADNDGDGIQDAGEPGISGVTVTLTYPNGTTATTTTDANGNYSFANLAPGTTYSVSFGTPTGYSPTASNQGGDDAADSDPVGGVVSNVSVTAGAANNTIDAGFVQSILNVGNVVWYDQNNDGIRQGTETGVAGATVRLYKDDNNDNVADGAAIATTTTDGNGVYNFASLAPGNYIVGVVIPAGYAVVATNGGDPDNNTDNDNNGTNTSVAGEVRSNAVSLAVGGEPAAGVDGDGTNGNLTVDFALTGTGSIGDKVFNDANGNGIQDAGEQGIGSAVVTLTYPNGTTASTLTDANGNYNFPNLVAGTYSVSFTQPTGFANVSPSNQGTNDAVDSDPVNGTVTGIVLANGQNNNTIDAGFFNCVPINSGINGPLSICATEPAAFSATGAGSGSVYTWMFDGGTPATATGVNVSSVWNTPGEYDIMLTVTKAGCTQTYTRSIVITPSIFANPGPDGTICQGGNTTVTGTGPLGASYSWAVVSGDPTSIDNGANQSTAAVSPLSTTVYRLTVTQNGCSRTALITVNVDVNRNPIANAGTDKTTLIGTPVQIGGSPTGTAPVSSPGAALGYIWSAAAGLNDNLIPNPTATPTVAGTTQYRVIVYVTATGCSDTAFVNVTGINPVNIGNIVWYDKNVNGVRDAGETPVNTTVNLYKDDNNDGVADGAAIATQNTVAGVYNFTNLFPGGYVVGAVIPNGYAVTSNPVANANSNVDNDNNGATIVGTEVRSGTVTVTDAAEPATGVDGDGTNGNLTIDFGFKGTAVIGDTVFYDTNRNGIQNAGEAGISGVTVTLTYPDNTTRTTTTAPNGSYSFTDLAPGTYNVTFAAPSGLVATLSNQGTDDTKDSDLVSGVVSGIVLTAGETNNTIDAGFHNVCSNTLRGNVWHDVDGMTDNLVDSVGAAATGVPIPTGLKINLVSLTTGKVVRVTTVLANGTYSITNIAPGSYIAVLSLTSGVVGQNPPNPSLPIGWSNTGEKVGTTPGADPIANGRLNVSNTFECVININFGIQFQNDETGGD